MREDNIVTNIGMERQSLSTYYYTERETDRNTDLDKPDKRADTSVFIHKPKSGEGLNDTIVLPNPLSYE